MAIGSVRPEDRHRVLSGLSSETKPTDSSVKVSTLFYETDTGNKFEYRGQPIGWVQV